MTVRARVLALALLAGVVAVSSALGGGRASSFSVTSSLDGRKVHLDTHPLTATGERP
jgi:hypothetical protein